MDAIWFTPAGLLILAPVVVWFWRKWRSAASKLGRVGDIILGTPAELDPLSGVELRPAVPDIGTRVASNEHLLEEVVLGSVRQAESSANAALAAATAAAESAAAAREVAQAAQVSAAETQAEVARIAGQIDEWQNTDRKTAEGLRAVVTELDLTPPPVSPAGVRRRKTDRSRPA